MSPVHCTELFVDIRDPVAQIQQQTTSGEQGPYLLKLVDIVVDVEVTINLRKKLRICTMVFTKPIVDVDVNLYQFLSLRTVLTHAHYSLSF